MEGAAIDPDAFHAFEAIFWTACSAEPWVAVKLAVAGGPADLPG